MSTVTLRLPDDVATRLKNIVNYRGISVNKLITEISVQAISAYDAETRFKIMASEVYVQEALAVLNRLDNEMTKVG